MAWCCAAVTWAGATATAQTALPGAAEPGKIDRGFQAPERPLSDGDGISVPRRDEQHAPEGAEAARFTLRGVTVEGATVFTAEDFRPLYQDLLGTETSVKTLYDLASAITARYTSAGYILSQAIVPQQRIGTDGVVRLQVVEGFVDRVIIDGNVGGPAALLRAYGEKISAERPLRLATLERYLLLASDLPGAGASGTLVPSREVPGAADLVFSVTHKMVDGVASLDNRGSRYVGPWQATTGANLNSLLGLYERTSVLAATTPFQPEELKYGRVSHEQTLDSEGTKLSVDAGQVTAHPGYLLKESAVRSRSVVVGLGLSHPLIRSRAENLTAHGRLEARNTSTRQQVEEIVSKDAIRALRLGGSYDWASTLAGEPGISLISLELSQGANVLGARPSGSDFLSVAKGRSDFFKVTAEASRTQRLSEQFSALAALTGQWTAVPLLSSEQFSVGGSQYGRGYDPAEISGDRGFAGKLELRFSGPEVDFVRDWQLYGFWDGGRTWLIEPPARQSRTRDLASTGFGLRSNLNDWVALNAELAVPLTHALTSVADDSGKDMRAFLGLVARY